jgi:prophage maintenance system killer protein
MTTEPQASVHYLTVQDILWINHEVTNEVLPYKYAQLEEATFGQYAYGGSQDVVQQAATFLSAFSRLRPFAHGNRASALIAVLTFLSINGYQIALDPANAAQWFEQASERSADSRVSILKAVAEGAPQPMDIKPAVRTTVRDLLKAFLQALSELVD